MKDTECKCGKKLYGALGLFIVFLKISLLIFTLDGGQSVLDTYYVNHVENNYIQVVDTDRED